MIHIGGLQDTHLKNYNLKFFYGKPQSSFHWPVQNEDSTSHVRKLLRISQWQQQSIQPKVRPFQVWAPFDSQPLCVMQELSSQCLQILQCWWQSVLLHRVPLQTGSHFVSLLCLLGMSPTFPWRPWLPGARQPSGMLPASFFLCRENGMHSSIKTAASLSSFQPPSEVLLEAEFVSSQNS